jgi:hypothetical protein
MKQKITIVLTILCFLPSTIVAQETEMLMERIEKTIKANEPKWKLLSKGFERNSCLARWGQPSSSNLPDPIKDEYLAVIRVHPSEKKAADELQDAFLMTSISMAQRGLSGYVSDSTMFLLSFARLQNLALGAWLNSLQIPFLPKQVHQSVNQSLD